VTCAGAPPPHAQSTMPSYALFGVVSAVLAVAACVAPASAALPVAGRRNAHYVGLAGSAWSYSTRNSTDTRPVDRRSLSSDQESGGSDGGGGGGGVRRSSVVDVATRTRDAPTAAARARRPQGVESARNSPRPYATGLFREPKTSALESPLYIPGRAAAAAAAAAAEASVRASVPDGRVRDGRVIPAGGEQGGAGYRVWAHGIRPPLRVGSVFGLCEPRDMRVSYHPVTRHHRRAAVPTKRAKPTPSASTKCAPASPPSTPLSRASTPTLDLSRPLDLQMDPRQGLTDILLRLALEYSIFEARDAFTCMSRLEVFNPAP